MAHFNRLVTGPNRCIRRKLHVTLPTGSAWSCNAHFMLPSYLEAVRINKMTYQDALRWIRNKLDRWRLGIFELEFYILHCGGVKTISRRFIASLNHGKGLVRSVTRLTDSLSQDNECVIEYNI